MTPQRGGDPSRSGHWAVAPQCQLIWRGPEGGMGGVARRGPTIREHRKGLPGCPVGRNSDAMEEDGGVANLVEISSLPSS